MKLANPKTGSRLPKGLNTEDQRPCGAMALAGRSFIGWRPQLDVCRTIRQEVSLTIADDNHGNSCRLSNSDCAAESFVLEWCSGSCQLLAIGQRSGPVYVGTALGRAGDFAGAAKLLGAVRHIGQSAAARIANRHATTVVGDVNGDHVLDTDLKGQP
jgi:hypothetical protein